MNAHQSKACLWSQWRILTAAASILSLSLCVHPRQTPLRRYLTRVCTAGTASSCCPKQGYPSPSFRRCGVGRQSLDILASWQGEPPADSWGKAKPYVFRASRPRAKSFLDASGKWPLSGDPGPSASVQVRSESLKGRAAKGSRHTLF